MHGTLPLAMVSRVAFRTLSANISVLRFFRIIRLTTGTEIVAFNCQWTFALLAILDSSYRCISIKPFCALITSWANGIVLAYLKRRVIFIFIEYINQYLNIEIKDFVN